MTLHSWHPKGWSAEAAVRGVLIKLKRSNPSLEECKQWAREFIQDRVPGWKPGVPLTQKEAQLIGRHFSYLVGGPSPKAPRQERRR